MIQIQEEDKKLGIKLHDPKNLVPYMFRCKECGCIVRKLEETNSYVLVALSKDVETKQARLCRFCRQLNEFRGVSE